MRRAGDGANDMVAVAQEPERSGQDSGLARPCRFRASASVSLLRRVEEARLRRDVGFRRGLRSTAGGAWLADRPTHRPRRHRNCNVSASPRARRARESRSCPRGWSLGRSRARAAARDGRARPFSIERRSFSVSAGDALIESSRRRRPATRLRSARASRPEPQASAAAARRPRPDADHRSEERLRLGPPAEGQVEALAAALDPAREAMLRAMLQARRAERTARRGPGPRFPPRRSESAREGRRHSRSSVVSVSCPTAEMSGIGDFPPRRAPPPPR